MVLKLLGMLVTDNVKWVLDWIAETGPVIILSFLFFLTPGMREL